MGMKCLRMSALPLYSAEELVIGQDAVGHRRNLANEDGSVVGALGCYFGARR